MSNQQLTQKEQNLKRQLGYAWKQYFLEREREIINSVNMINNYGSIIPEISVNQKKFLKGVIDSIPSWDKVCSICLENDKTDITITNCGHFFHGNCLDGLPNTVCPNCRQDIEPLFKLN